MVRTRKERKAATEFKLAQPDRCIPSDKTLLDIAQEHKLFELADEHPANKRKRRNDAGEGNYRGDAELSPAAERILESLLWTVSLAMLHFTLDVLVQHQYAMEISWPQITTRALVALVGMIWHH
jgi:hypothetical protein